MRIALVVNDKSIAKADVGAVALAAIQERHQIVKGKSGSPVHGKIERGDGRATGRHREAVRSKTIS